MIQQLRKRKAHPDFLREREEEIKRLLKKPKSECQPCKVDPILREESELLKETMKECKSAIPTNNTIISNVRHK